MLCKRVGFFEEGYICRGSSSTTKGELGLVGQEGHLALIGVSADGAATRNCCLHRENILCKQCMYMLLVCISIWIRYDEEMMMK